MSAEPLISEGEASALGALMGEAAALDAADALPPANPAMEAYAVQVASANRAEIAATLTIVRTMLCPLLPPPKGDQIAAIWSDAVIEQAAAAGAAVMDLHGWSMGETMGKYGPYIALIAAVGPPALATRAVMLAPAPKTVRTEGAADGDRQQQPA